MKTTNTETFFENDIKLAGVGEANDIVVKIVPYPKGETPCKLEAKLDEYLDRLNKVNAFGRLHISGDNTTSPIWITVDSEANMSALLDSIFRINPYGRCKGLLVFDIRESNVTESVRNLTQLVRFVDDNRLCLETCGNKTQALFTTIFIVNDGRNEIDAFYNLFTKVANRTNAVVLDGKDITDTKVTSIETYKGKDISEDALKYISSERIASAVKYAGAAKAKSISAGQLLKVAENYNNGHRIIGF